MAKLRVRVITTVRLCVIAGALAWSHLAFSQPDPSDMCSGTDLDAGGCEWYQVATAYAYTGDQRTFAWVPDPADMFRRGDCRGPGDHLLDTDEQRPLPPQGDGLRS